MSLVAASSERLRHALQLRLALLGHPTADDPVSAAWTEVAAPLFARQRELSRHLAERLPPADERIQAFLDDYLGAVGPVARLPARTFVLDQPGMARAVSLPDGKDTCKSPLLQSYRLHNGILHNPAKDRRTTQGVFHIAEGGLPVPDDKFAVPVLAYARMLALALRPPAELLRLPFTAERPEPAECLVSLYLRPLVVPEVPGVTVAKRMEIRFFAPGSLVSNLDFVETIFGNAGDPSLPENDAALDTEGWTGHTGCVILAPHLIHVRKQELGLPHWDEATPRQRRDGMCWRDPAELYNNGGAFKLCARDARGVIVTILADNYYGYCKKEVKTQLSYAANLCGTEEEHAGGALVFPSYDLGDEFGEYAEITSEHTVATVVERDPAAWSLQAEGYARSTRLPDVLLVPEQTRFNLRSLAVTWQAEDGSARKLPLLAGQVYFRPSGYRVELTPVRDQRARWRLVGTIPTPTLCHKPATVSGGGKSEISKAISDAILPGQVFVADIEHDFDTVEQLLARDYRDRFLDPDRNGKDDRPILSPRRTLGSVIKLFTPSRREYSASYNTFLREIPQHIKELVLVVKRYYKPEWGAQWRQHFTVDTINGRPANELKLDGRKLVVNTLRVGYEEDGSWRIFGLRHDFHPAAKVQMEDDITASLVVPAADPSLPSLKYVENCEAYLFQRPDDAIHRGYDRQAELDIATLGTFMSNYQALTAADAQAFRADAVGFSTFTKPMRDLIRRACAREDATAGRPNPFAPEPHAPAYFVSSAHPRLVNGHPSKNPRYLQLRPDRARPRETALAYLGVRLHRHVKADAPVHTPVDLVVPGRRNNPPEPGVRALCVFNPIHYLELPELFLEFISSMTGKSPSTTGAGSEGALTKGPFNALHPIIDLNAALVSYILTGHDVFISSAGYVGPKVRVDHDVSLLVPEVFSRMSASERSARHLIAEGCLERCQDTTHEGKAVLSSRLGYRITTRFVRIYCGRMFTHPHAVFTDDMLRPELQDAAIFADGMDNIVATHQRVAESYFADGGIELALPPLRALLHIMAYGHYEGQGLDAPAVRQLFTREHFMASAAYQARLGARARSDKALWQRHLNTLEQVVHDPHCADLRERLPLLARREQARHALAYTSRADYPARLIGSLGIQPL